MKDLIQIVYGNTEFRDMVKAAMPVRPTPELLDTFVTLALDLHNVFGVMATVKLGRSYTEHLLVLWHPCSNHELVVSTPSHSEPDAIGLASFMQGKISMKEVEDDLADPSKVVKVRPEYEGHMLRLHSLGLHIQQPEGDRDDVLPMRDAPVRAA